MNKLSRVARIDTVIAGIIAGLAAASPAFAALPFEMPFTGTGMPMRDWILMGSLMLLAVAVAIKLLRGREMNEPMTDAEDMRWWRNP